MNSKQQFNTEVVKRLEFTTQYTFSPNIFVHVQIVDMSILLIYFVISHRNFPTNGKEKSIASLIQRMKGDFSYFFMEHLGVIVYGAPSVSRIVEET